MIIFELFQKTTIGGLNGTPPGVAAVAVPNGRCAQDGRYIRERGILSREEGIHQVHMSGKLVLQDNEPIGAYIGRYIQRTNAQKV